MSHDRKNQDCLKTQKHHRIKGRFCSGFARMGELDHRLG